MVGNFIADFVKGKAALAMFTDEIKTGIELHRAIDYFTDNHPVVSQSKDRLRPKYRHYSSVIVDVFYDHFLAKYWDQFSSVPLSVFAASAYSILQSYASSAPEEVNYLLPHMIRGNWLVNYSKPEGINRALSGMASRTPYLSKMDEATEELIRYEEDFKREFDIFFPELKQHAEQFLAEKGMPI
jgi:acyl carrier protein phosphodiesterase